MQFCFFISSSEAVSVSGSKFVLSGTGKRREVFVAHEFRKSACT